ncbi:MAG TPA: tetratricopeptide repeat protein [Gemmatimonadales bacterium]|nr:tetratricopeptide repeat protein [Gemmatimonadales bacterium]
MADDVKTLSTELAQDPDSLVFLRLGELLRQRGQLDAAHRVALSGLGRHPHLADAHDLCARVLTDKRDYERAFDEWDMALRIAPTHIGALKGLAYLYFKVGDVAQAEAHLAAAQRAAPDDPTLRQAAVRLADGDRRSAAVVLGAAPAPPPPAPPAPPPVPRRTPVPEATPTAVAPLSEGRVFAGLEGADEGLLLLDSAGRVLGGALRDPGGADVTERVAAYLAGVSQEAARTAKLLGLGAWTGLAAEGERGHAHLAQPGPDALLLVVRDRAVPMGRLAIIAERAAQAARRWLETHT